MFFKKGYYRLLLLIVSILLNCYSLYSQVDSSYIQPFSQDFSARVYIYDKFAGFKNEDKDDNEVEFKTNNPVSLGVGATWKYFSVSLSHGFDFFRDKKQGKTQSLEFKHHGYGQKFAYDIFIQRHKGFYEDRKDENGVYSLYPEMKLNMYGGSFYYIFNNKKFSYRAAFNMSERQMKSAGSLLLGGSVYFSKVLSERGLLFEDMNEQHKNLQFGLSLGYAYTWVISRQWLATGSLVGGATVGNNHPDHFFKKKMQVYPTLNGRFALVYNSNSWSVNTTFLYNSVYLFYKDDQSLTMNNQQIQLTLVKRFDWYNKRVDKVLNKTKDILSF